MVLLYLFGEDTTTLKMGSLYIGFFVKKKGFIEKWVL
jgi:hypothetical protein